MNHRSDSIKSIGQWGEDQAVKYLKRNGYRVLERNYSCRFGEIDIIAKDREEIVFVEVKTRKDDRFGEAKEFVGPSKQRRVLSAASTWLASTESEFDPRFDVIEVYGEAGQRYRDIRINHIKNAFD